MHTVYHFQSVITDCVKRRTLFNGEKNVTTSTKKILSDKAIMIPGDCRFILHKLSLRRENNISKTTNIIFILI